jgi:hypothetical protein
VLTDLDTDLVCAVSVTAANLPEAGVAEQITADLQAQGRTLFDLRRVAVVHNLHVIAPPTPSRPERLPSQAGRPGLVGHSCANEVPYRPM